MKLCKSMIGVSIVWLYCTVHFAGAEVVDFSHLMDEVDEALSNAEDFEPQSRVVSGDADAVLASRVAELEEMVARRDRQIAELKQALEETTSEFSTRLAEMRSSQEEETSKQLEELTLALAEAEQRVAEVESQRIGELEVALADAEQKVDDAEQKVAEVEAHLAETEEQLSALQEAKETAASAHEKEMAALRERHVEQIETLQRGHEAALASAKAAHDTLQADTARDREDARRLRGEVSRLEAALRVEKQQNERERFLLAYNSGSLFLAAGRYDRAEEELLKALSVREDDAALHYNLGVLYDEHLSRPERARRHYERFLELAPNDRDAPMVMQWLREL